MSNLKELKPVQEVQNIISNFCYTIGMIPTSYKLALTVQEQILAIGKYLEETVIPALNNNAEAVVELQNLYIELKNYVDNYFANLDVQNEINNKIDDLVNDGTFEDMLEPLLENLQNAILNLNNSKRDKNVLITMNDLSQDVKSAMTGGSVAIVGNQSVNNASVQDFSLSPSKMNFVNQINNNLLDMSLVSNTVYNKNGTTSTNGNFVASDFIDVGEVVLNETTFSTNASGGGFVLFDSKKEFIELRGNKSITIDNNKIKYIQLNIYKQDPNYDILYIVKNNLRPIYVNKLNKPSFLKNNNIFVETDNLIGNTIKPDNVTFINHITNNLYNKNLVNKNGYFDLNGFYREIGRNAPLSNYGSEIMNLPTYIKDETVFYQYPCPGTVSFFDNNFGFLGNLETANAPSFTIPYENATYVVKSLENINFDKYYIILGTNNLENYYQLSPEILLPAQQLNSILTGKKIGFLGDSVTFGLMANKPYPEVIQENVNCISTNYGISGNTIAKAGPNGQPNARTNPMCIRYADMSDDLDYILVFGGSNDYAYQTPIGEETSYDIENFYGGLNTLILGLIEKYCGKPILFLTPLYRPLNYESGYKFMDYVNAIKSRCAYYSIPCFNLTDYSTIKSTIPIVNSTYYGDYLHPNDEGHKILARIIQHQLEII